MLLPHRWVSSYLGHFLGAFLGWARGASLSAGRRLALVGALCAFGAVVTSRASAQASAVAAAGNGDSPYALLEQLARVLVLVENEYVEPVDRDRLLEGAIGGMVAALDPHSSYLPPSDYTVFRADTEGRFGGIGVEVDFRNDRITVIAPIDGSPAARAGVRPGDRIVSIDGESVAGRSAESLVKQMRGKPGSKVTIVIERPSTKGTSRPIEVTLTREVIRVSSLLAKRLDGDVAYLRIKAFQAGTHRELLQWVGRLKREVARPIAGVVLDLRNNPGGLVDEAAAVADEFLPGGVVYTTRRRGEVIDEVRATSGGIFRRGPVVVLVNEYSASAAELVAGALQDHRRAVVVGAPTFGKGSVQSILDLPDGAGLRLTTMLYFTPSGRTIQARGIRPTVLVGAAYVKDRRFTVVREADLDNHLLGGASGPDEGPAAGEDTSDELHLGVARDIPLDPTESDDVALSVGYQIVRGVLPLR